MDEPFGIPEKRLVSHDGVTLSYWISRPPFPQDCGITLVLSNGIGVTRDVWQDFVAVFQDRHTLLFWDYRGTFNSDRLTDAHRLSIPANAQDLAALLEAEDLRGAVLLGWSMGVQVNLEVWRFAPDRIAGMILLNGTGGNTFDTALGLPGLIYWVPPVTRYLSQHHGRRLNRYFSQIFRRELINVLRATGFVAPTVDTSMLARLLDAYATHDFSTYFHLLNGLGLHRPDHLHQIDVPVLIMVGGRDQLTPPITGKRLRDRLPNAELDRIDDGTHFMMLEYPGRVRRRIDRFLEERIAGRPAIATKPGTNRTHRG